MKSNQRREALSKGYSLRKWAGNMLNIATNGEPVAEEKFSSINNKLLSLYCDTSNCVSDDDYDYDESATCCIKTSQQKATNESFCAITNIIKKKKQQQQQQQQTDNLGRKQVVRNSWANCSHQCKQTMYKSTTATNQQVLAQTTSRQRQQQQQQLRDMKPFKNALKQQRSVNKSRRVVGSQIADFITMNLLLVCTCSLVLVSSSGAYAFSESNSAATVAANLVASSPETGNKLPLTGSSANERVDKAAQSVETMSKQQVQTSVLASLSSAVASAAAAATVAAAQSALTGSDARSLLTGSRQGSASPGTAAAAKAAGVSHQQRSPGIHLAFKLADAIPEVPYHILHNMKKLDHAAPFYNVANKMSPIGASKESSHGFTLANALASTSNSFGAEQLRALFQSPLWKRIADGYGEFTSEFRSLFRAPAHPMKGTTSSTTKLLRDLSVPAMLMLLASAVPNNWLPTKTRRKSLLAPATDLANANNQLNSLIDPLSMSGSVEMPNYSIPPSLFNAATSHLSPRSLNNQNNNNNKNYLSPSGQLSRASGNPASDIYLSQQGGELSSLAQPTNWMSLQQEQQQQPQQQHQPQNGLDSTQQMQQVVQRVGEPLPADQASPVLSGSTKRDMKPVKRAYSSPASLLEQAVSSLTFLTNQPTTSGKDGNDGTVGGAASGDSSSSSSGKLMSKLLNVNGNQQSELGNSYKRMMSSEGSGSDALAGLSSNGITLPWQRMSPWSTNARSDNQLDEKHRYSLVEDSDSLAQFSKIPFKWASNSLEEQRQQGEEKLSSPSSSLSSKPFLLSAMTQVIGSMFNAPRSSAAGSLLRTESGSSAVPSNHHHHHHHHHQQQQQQQVRSGINSKLESVGDKTIINQHNKESVLRRQLVGGSSNSNSITNIGALAEQRELSQLLPQSWREAVKRTMSNVQQQASTQWRSIEGQLTSWVQDKLKSLPTGGSPSLSSPSSSSSSSSSTSTAAANSPTPVANLIASVSSTALNLLGISGKGISALAGSNPPARSSSPDMVGSPIAGSTSSSSSSSSSAGGKHESPSRTGLVQPAKSALVGVSNMIVNTLTNRQVPTTAAGSPSTASAQKSAPESSLSSSISQYPTLTGAQASQQAVVSPASGTASSSVTQST